MNCKLIITDSIYFRNLLSEKSSITFELNYSNIRSKIDIEELKNLFLSFPMVDAFKVIEIDISLYSLSELKEILSIATTSRNSKTLFYYYLKDLSDKVDQKVELAFKKEKVNIIKKKGVDLKEVSKILKEKNLNINPMEFQNQGNMDTVLNDIEKIISLNDTSSFRECLTDCFESNIFKFIDYVVSNDPFEALKSLSVLDDNDYLINLLLLKHLILLRDIKSNRDYTVVDKLNGGNGKAIHPFRLKKMQESKVNINLDKAISILLENDSKKVFNLESSLLQIMSL